MESYWHPMVEMRPRDRPLLNLLGVKNREMARVAIFIENVGQQIAFALACPDTPGHEDGFRHSTARTRSINAHLPGGVIEMPDAAMKDVVAARAADASDIAVPVTQPCASRVDARILTSLVAKSVCGETSWLAPIDFPGVSNCVARRWSVGEPSANGNSGTSCWQTSTTIRSPWLNAFIKCHTMHGAPVKHPMSSAPPFLGITPTWVPSPAPMR